MVYNLRAALFRRNGHGKGSNYDYRQTYEYVVCSHYLPITVVLVVVGTGYYTGYYAYIGLAAYTFHPKQTFGSCFDHNHGTAKL